MAVVTVVCLEIASLERVAVLVKVDVLLCFDAEDVACTSFGTGDDCASIDTFVGLNETERGLGDVVVAVDV